MASAETNRIAKNTVYLYIRQGVSMLISFFTVSVTLKVLGVTDYGINSVVAGAVTMFNFLTGAMGVGNQRFFSFYLGNGDYAKLKRIFGGTLTIYLILIVVFLILGESIGLWFVKEKLVIPSHRLDAAIWLYQLGLAGLCVNLLLPPYLGLITAHEDMGIYAKMTIWESIARLVTLYLLVILPFDKLIVYGSIGFCITIITETIYIIYCRRKYPECHTTPIWDKAILKELVGFNFWNLFGNFGWMIKNQGTAFVLNLFLGPAVNAAHQIASSVRTYSGIFSNGFTTALNPQITKSYASGNYEHMFKISFSGAKLTYMLLGMVIIPAIFNIGLVLDLWLPEVPEYAVVFCQILLVETLIDQVGYLFNTITQATGKVKTFQLLIGMFGFLNLPVSFIALKLGASPEWVFIISVFFQICVNAVRIGFIRKVDKNAIKRCFTQCLLPCFYAAAAAFAFCWILPQSGKITIAVPIILLEILAVLFFGYFIALNSEEKAMAMEYISKFKNKFKSKNQ